MKKCRKLTILTIVLVFVFNCFACLTAAAALNNKDVVVSLQINNPLMDVNGIQAEIDAGRGTKPVVTNGRTLVPIRAIIEAFDGVVEWNDETQTVELTMEDDVITLVINSNTAYLNNQAYTLDVAPKVINSRTMLPIRFVAEGFNLGVAWEADTQTVTIIKNSLDQQEYNYLLSVIPAYTDSPYVHINNGVPMFKEYEIIGGSFEYYSSLDDLGRCDVCMASISNDIMPQDERESISSVTPTGWINKSYDTISGKYLYNRCHLIGYQLTGENANKRNIITGTRYLNIEGMLPFENMIDDYIEQTGNHVMYRVTPIFKQNNLVADGVLLEAYSVEDNGYGICFCVYCYNVEPTVIIDYSTGDSTLKNSAPKEDVLNNVNDNINTDMSVYRTPTGKKYHYDAQCGGKNSFVITINQATALGLTPCSKCTK